MEACLVTLCLQVVRETWPGFTYCSRTKLSLLTTSLTWEYYILSMKLIKLFFFNKMFAWNIFIFIWTVYVLHYYWFRFLWLKKYLVAFMNVNLKFEQMCVYILILFNSLNNIGHWASYSQTEHTHTHTHTYKPASDKYIYSYSQQRDDQTVFLFLCQKPSRTVQIQVILAHTQK